MDHLGLDYQTLSHVTMPDQKKLCGGIIYRLLYLIMLFEELFSGD